MNTGTIEKAAMDQRANTGSGSCMPKCGPDPVQALYQIVLPTLLGQLWGDLAPKILSNTITLDPKFNCTVWG